MSFEKFISYRYLSASRGRFLRFLNTISIVGVAIGVCALIVVLSVMTGFGNNLREKIIGTTPHIMIEKETGILNYENLQNQIASMEKVKGVAPYVQGNLFLESAGQALGVIIRGISPTYEPNVTKVEQYLLEGKIQDLSPEKVIIGAELARYYGFSVGDKLTLISPRSGIAGEGWRYELTISGIFRTGMIDFDTNLLILHLQKAQEIFQMPGRVSGLGVSVEHPYQVEALQKKLYDTIGFSFLIRTWIDQNRNLFDALWLEKWGLFLLLTMMILVASFNIISTLIVTVTSKVHDIGILQSVGVPKSSIRKIFTKQGIYIGFLGTFWGTVFGLGICYVLGHYVQVPAEIYSIDRVPVDIQLFDMCCIIGAAMFISFVASIYPAARAANLQPVDALRYE